MITQPHQGGKGIAGPIAMDERRTPVSTARALPQPGAGHPAGRAVPACSGTSGAGSVVEVDFAHPREKPEKPGLETQLQVRLLMQWRDEEIAAACGRFRRLTREEIEDVYDAAVDDLHERWHEHELHLRRALLLAIRFRALWRIRDRRNREQIIEDAAPGFYEEASRRAWQDDPERAVLALEDDVIIGEFIAELTLQERQAFALIADGLAWRAVGNALGIAQIEARRVTRSVEKKRERFLTLYQSGRLCGYRSRTIGSLLSGEEDGEMQVRQALAHLRYCRECRGEHKITGKQLQARFDSAALALLPAPLLASPHASLLDRILTVLHKPIRLLERLSTGNGTVRERTAEGAAGGAMAAKAAIAVGVIAVTGGAIAIHHVIGPSHHASHSSTSQPSRAGDTAATLSGLSEAHSNLLHWPTQTSPRSGSQGPGHIVTAAGPGHIVAASGPGRVVGGGGSEGPGHVVSARQAPMRAREASNNTSPPIGQITTTGASPVAPGRVTSTPSASPSRLGRVLGP